MKRRRFLNNAIIGTASTVSLNACRQETPAPNASSSNSPLIRWRMATSWSKSLDIMFGGAETICQRVSEMTDRAFTITPYASGEIVSGLKVFDAVAAGEIECGHTSSTYYTSKNPAFAFASSVPFGLTADQQNAWLYFGGGLETMQKLYADYGLINFPAGNFGVQMGGWFKRPINAIADLKGLKMRIPGLGGQVLKRLGVEVSLLPAESIFAALEQGKIDAAEWGSPYDDERLGLNRVVSLYYYPGWWEPGTASEVLINLEEWQKLPQKYREVFQVAAAEANLKVLAEYDVANCQALERLVLNGTKLLAYSPEILQATYKATFEFYEETANTDATFGTIYEQWKKFRAQIYQWNKINELSLTSLLG